MLHSLKGSSGMLGFEIVGSLAHELEERFERYRSGRATLDRETTTLILQAVDFFRAFLSRLRTGDPTQGDPQPLLRQLRSQSETTSTSVHLPEFPSPTAGSKPAAAATTVPERSLSQGGGLRIRVRFRQGLQLADLKARLILSRLSAIGEIISCDPPVDDIDSFEELTLFSLCLMTSKSVDEVRKIASVDGVESVDVTTSSLSGDSITAWPGVEGQEAEQFARLLSAPEISPASPPLVALSAVPVAAVASQVAAAPADSASPEPLSDPDRQSASGQSAEDSARDPRAAVQETLRVDISRLDQLLNLTGELVVANAAAINCSPTRLPFIDGRLASEDRRSFAKTCVVVSSVCGHGCRVSPRDFASAVICLGVLMKNLTCWTAKRLFRRLAGDSTATWPRPSIS
ncbi:MAG UNVERIFIED_CONTAM: Hpt domain-containing protein [Planctomycetaceae bacterium]|jgi:two-component system chemotaxis sensor kinase CheA